MDDIYDKITDNKEFGVDFDGKSEIQTFFAGQTIFLTGGTGFLGKCFVEKLLRVCPDIEKLYLMVRPLKKTIDERVKKYFQNVLFDKLRKSNPTVESKVIAIEGDMTSKNLGLSEYDRNCIIRDVTIIIHAASCVIFEARITELFRANVLGTQYMLNLAKDVKNLKVFVYVSTAFSHCYQQYIEDICYPPPIDLKTVMKYIDIDEHITRGIHKMIRRKIQKPWPNMYAYSKAIAESLIESFAKELSFRCIIYRPCIVLPTYQEPITGWIGNAHGPTIGTIGFALGYMHIIYGGDHPADVIPVLSRELRIQFPRLNYFITNYI